jgi:hypothetical protein
METEDGVIVMLVTGFVGVLVPLQATMTLKLKIEIRAAATRAAENCRMHPPRRVDSGGFIKPKNASSQNFECRS